MRTLWWLIHTVAAVFSASLLVALLAPIIKSGNYVSHVHPAEVMSARDVLLFVTWFGIILASTAKAAFDAWKAAL